MSRRLSWRRTVRCVPFYVLCFVILLMVDVHMSFNFIIGILALAVLLSISLWIYLHMESSKGSKTTGESDRSLQEKTNLQSHTLNPQHNPDNRVKRQELLMSPKSPTKESGHNDTQPTPETPERNELSKNTEVHDTPRTRFSDLTHDVLNIMSHF